MASSRCSLLRQLPQTTSRRSIRLSAAYRHGVNQQWPCRSPQTISRRTLASAVSASELQFGQPLHETHPHLLGPGELTPGITALEYSHRRSKLAAKLPENSIAILAASDVKFRSGSVFYDFHQEPNFFYLTGFNEPDALAVIGKSETEGDHTFHLFVRPKDPKEEIWEGPRSGLEAATDVFNADETGDIAHLHKHLKPLLASASTIYTDIPFNKPASQSILSRLLSNTTTSPSSTSSTSTTALLSSQPNRPLRPLIHALRATKSPAEIACMRHAGALSGRAFQAAMRRGWDSEASLANFLEHRFKQLGCSGSAYIPVVAGGRNALTIHYVRNDQQLAASDTVLVDAGGSWGGYVADITRTFPAGHRARFGPAQRELYEAVLRVQRTCVALCRESAGLGLDALHGVAERGIREQLSALGFETGGRAMEVLFPHHVGHYVGLDVHDTPGWSRREVLREGQAITIEPGVYVPDDERWPERFRGLGVRIEDCVVVGKDDPIILTVEAPKEVVDIEALKEEGLEVERAENLR